MPDAGRQASVGVCVFEVPVTQGWCGLFPGVDGEGEWPIAASQRTNEVGHLVHIIHRVARSGAGKVYSSVGRDEGVNVGSHHVWLNEGLPRPVVVLDGGIAVLGPHMRE